MSIIITVDGPQSEILKKITENIKEDELALAKEIVEKLYAALQPYLPAAGLAAPQIGISKSVFIFSYDRDPKNLEAVINPTFIPITDEQVAGWEGCFSILLCENNWKLAKVPRYESIEATYFNLNGEKIVKRLNGFAAKVFQHEYDHLQGLETIDRDDAEIKSFVSKDELMQYLQAVKKDDATRYKKPEEQ